MDNTGFISSSGTVQIFTSGPYSGTKVTSSFSFASTLFGGPLDTFQPFISGVIDEIIPCPTTNFINGVTYFERLYFDPIECPPPGFCPPPTLISASRNGCDPFIRTNYIVNFESGSTASPTILEYSLFDNFSITGSTSLTNPITSSVNVLINGFSPQATSPVYFRAYNSCSVSSTSSYSNVVIANNCELIISPTETFTLTFINSSSRVVQVDDLSDPPLNLSAGQTLSFILDNIFSEFEIKIASGQQCPSARMNVSLTTSTPDILGLVSTSINSLLIPLDCEGNGDFFTTEFYDVLPNNQPTLYPLHKPSPDLNLQAPTNIIVDRSNYPSEGEIIVTIVEVDGQGGVIEI